MGMFGRLVGRRGPDGKPAKKDKAIVHQFVPEEVLYPDGRPEHVADTSWLEAVPDRPQSATAQAKPASQPATPKPAVRPAPAASASPAQQPPAPAVAAVTAKGAPNSSAADRPRFPCGWMVVVEGPGVGEWFVLERGTSHIGAGKGQTVQLDFGDDGIAEQEHAALTYNEAQQQFVLHGEAAGTLRINGVTASKDTHLRDGDVVSLGRTSLRLVALCSPNFHWASELIDI